MERHVRSAALFVLLAGSALIAGQNPPPAPAGAQTPTFKLRVDYVEVDALATDRQGAFVRDLKKEDFQILEDGKPQIISSFGIVDIPVERADRPLYTSTPVEPDMKTNERPFDGRMYVMVIDDQHTLFSRTQRVKIAAKQFIQRNLGANDLMAVVHTSGPSDASQEFTNNRRLLMAAVDRATGQKLPSATVSRTEEFFRRREGMGGTDPLNDPDDAERAYKAKGTLETLQKVADWFGSVRGRRKAILFVSEGIDYDVTSVFDASNEANNQASSILDATRDVIAAATRSNVSIYGIDPRGMTGLDDESIGLGSFPTALPDDASGNPSAVDNKYVQSLGLGMSSLQNEVRMSQDSLRTLSDETGGFAVVNRNQFDTAFDRIVTDNSSYYVLAYYPPTDKPGKFHKIEVRVTRPGVSVRARRGYTLPKTKTASTRPAASAPIAEVLDALDSPIPLSGLTMRVFAAPFKGTAPNASVLFGVEMRGRDLKPAPNAAVQLSYRAIDAQGKVRAGNTDTMTLNLRPETLARVGASGIRVLKRIDLPPGRYQLHVAAHDTSGGNIGSVTYDLDVPDFSKNALDMSGVVLTSTSGAAHLTTRPDELLQDVLPGPPVGLRTFPQSDDVTLFAEVYDSDGDRPHKVAITATVTSDTGQVLFKSDEARSSSDLGGKRGGYGIVTRVPMKDLPPGGYVLKVEAKSSLGAGPTTAREVRFAVEPVPVAPRQ